MQIHDQRKVHQPLLSSILDFTARYDALKHEKLAAQIAEDCGVQVIGRKIDTIKF